MHSRTTSSHDERLPGIVAPLVLVIAGFAASCGMPDGPPQPDSGQKVTCKLVSGQLLTGEVTDSAPGAVRVGRTWIDWDRVEFWHPASD